MSERHETCRTLVKARHRLDVWRTTRVVSPATRWQPADVETLTEFTCNDRLVDPEKHARLVEYVWRNGR